MAGESEPKDAVRPELDGYFAQFSIDELRVREADLVGRLAGGEGSGEAKQWRRALRRVQGTIAAKVQGASGVRTGEAVSRPEAAARPAAESRPTVPPQERRGGSFRETVRGVAARVVDAMGGGGRGRVVTDPTASRPVEPVRRGPDPAAAVRQAAADVRAAAPATSPAAIAASPSMTPGSGSTYVQKQAAAAAGGGGRGPTGRWGVEAEVLGDDEESAA